MVPEAEWEGEQPDPATLSCCYLELADQVHQA